MVKTQKSLSVPAEMIEISVLSSIQFRDHGRLLDYNRSVHSTVLQGDGTIIDALSFCPQARHVCGKMTSDQTKLVYVALK